MQSNPQAFSYIMIIGMLVLFYFMLFRPQRQQQKKRDEMLKSLAVGDKVLTTAGIFGEITEIREKSIRVKVAKDVVVRMTRAGIQMKTSAGQDE